MLGADLAVLCLFALDWTSRWLLAECGTLSDIFVISILVFQNIVKHAYGYGFWNQNLLANTVSGTIAISAVSFFCYLISKGLLAPVHESHDGVDRDGVHPYICPSRTSHTRLFPKKHSFSYSYLLVVIPVGWRGRVGSLISVDRESILSAEPQARWTKKWSWISVNSSDHLNRGDGHLGLRNKLAVYLSTRGIDIEEYTSSWLVTAPRFLGYAFNPVSFWYLYKGSKLSAMILEVNNTFGERRMYLMKQEIVQSPNRPGDDSPTQKPQSGDTKDRFTHQWAKDFHVSPFNSRKGSYALVAQDIFTSLKPTIDNTITLSSSKSDAKIVARVYSTGEALDPAQIPLASKLHFLSSWFWVGFMTFPRIIKEAAKLFFRRKLHVWYRPEVLRGSIGRQETSRERTIEGCVREYLRQAVHSSALAVPLKYMTAGQEQGRQAIFHTPLSASLKQPPQPVELQILTPQFYTDLVLSSDPYIYMKSHHLRPVAEKTFSTSNIHILLSFFQQDLKTPDKNTPVPISSAWRWLFRLRRSAGHQLDDFARKYMPEEAENAYRGAATGLLIAKYIAFGIPELLDLALLLLRLCLCYISFGALLAKAQCQGSGTYGRIDWIVGGIHVWLVGEEWLRRRCSTRVDT